jgi:hypothetical protein
MNVGPSLPSLLLVAALASCGRAASPPPPEASQLRLHASEALAAIEAYRVPAASVESAAACRALRSGYEVRMESAMTAISAVAPALDAWTRGRSGPDHADLECVVAALRKEIERHTDIACTALDPGSNRAEAAAHAGVVERWASLLAARAEEIAGARGEEAPARGPRCVRFADGSLMYLP